jgi:hypothetical protein
MNTDERARLWVVAFNAAAAVAVVVLSDPELRAAAMAWWRQLASAAEGRYHRREPSPADVSAMQAEARAITREAAPE